MDGFDFTEDFDIEITDSAFQKNYGLRWRHEYGGTIACRPCESEGIVYFGCDNYYFYALDAKTGKEIWKFRTGGSPSKEKVIDHSEVALVTIITGEGVTVEDEKPIDYGPNPEIQIIENEYTTKSEYSSGGSGYRSGGSEYR